MLHIKPEKAEDIDIISEINRQAFGGETESDLITSIRASENFIPELSLVAELDDRLVGHILFSVISIQQSDGDHPALSLAPMAVLPSHQGQGIGSALVLRGVKECRRLGHEAVIVVGHPEYYPRFGFEPARKFGLSMEFDVPDEAFMVLELEKGVLKNIRGMVKYPPAFDSAT